MSANALLGSSKPKAATVAFLLVANSSALLSSAFPFEGVWSSFSRVLQFLICASLALLLWAGSKNVLGKGLIVLYLLAQLANGLLNKADIPASMTVLGSYLLIFSLLNYLLHQDERCIVDLLKQLIAWSLGLLVAADMGNWVVRGRGLPLLNEIQMPVIVLSYLFLLSWKRKQCFGDIKLGRMFLYLGSSILYFFVSAYVDYHLSPDHEKFQQIQFGLIALALFLWFVFSVVDKYAISINGMRIYWYKIALFVVASVVVFFGKNIYDLIVLARPGSALLRFAVTASMISSMTVRSWLVGFGFGSSWQKFDVLQFSPEEFQFEFEDMYPHSGVAILGFENGILGVLLVAIYVYWIFALARKMLPFDLQRKLESARGNSGRNFMVIIGVFWLTQNLLYVQGVPVPDVYFQSHIVIYSILIVLVFRSVYPTMFGLLRNAARETGQFTPVTLRHEAG